MSNLQNKKSQLTESDVNSLQQILNTEGRTAFYIEYYELTGSEQAMLQAQISSFSSFVGGIAYAANLSVAGILGSKYPYGGVEGFSEAISKAELNAISNDVKNGGTGILSDGELMEVAYQV